MGTATFPRVLVSLRNVKTGKTKQVVERQLPGDEVVTVGSRLFRTWEGVAVSDFDAPAVAS